MPVSSSEAVPCPCCGAVLACTAAGAGQGPCVPLPAPPPPRRNAGLLHVCTGGRQDKAQEEMWLVSGLQDRRCPSVTRMRHEDARGQSTERTNAEAAQRHVVTTAMRRPPDPTVDCPLSSLTNGTAVPPKTCSYPPCGIPSGCCSFKGPWTVTCSSLRMLRRVAAFCRPLRPVLLLVSFPRSRSPVFGVLGLCCMWHGVPFACPSPPLV